MSKAVDFYFDFSSHYGYFAAHLVGPMAARHDREVNWRPIMLGAAMKRSGNTPLTSQPLKADYVLRDWARMARLHGLPWRFPERFPVAALAPARGFYWMTDERPEQARAFALAAFAAYFGEGVDISDPEAAADVAADVGADRDGFLAAVADPRIKQRLKDETEAALARGVFGSPFLIVDDEPFWGCDRIDMAERWIETGGW